MRFRSIAQTKLALPIGILALVSAILMERFLPSTEGLNFIEGLLFGMSLVFNMSYILGLRKQQKEIKNKRVKS
jgi:predicted Kef-type K+ transport protein